MEVNKKQLADIFGASIRTIQNWQEQGMPVLRGGGKGNEVLYDSAAVIRWYAERDAEIENEKLRREVEELRQASEADLQPGTIEYERHRLTRAQADAQELKNARDSAEVVETAFCTFVLSRIAGEIASILDGLPLSVQRRFPELENRHVDFLKRDIIKAMNKAAALDELIWGLKLPTLRQRLFRCVSIRENDDGTYAITAVQHVPEKEAIVDNGAHFDGDLSGTVNGVTPPAVQHLTAEVTADSGEYQVLARWDTPKVVKGVSFMLRLTVAADDGSERLVSTARTTETTYRFTQLALGRYTLTVRAVNAWGQQGDPASVSFRIAAPVAPSRIELTPGYFQITATPHLAVYDPTVQFEFWFSEKRITDIRQVETTARYLGTGLYWIAASINIKPGHDYYFYIRSVNTVGKSAFVEAVGRASDDAEGYLDFFKGEIGKTHLAQELWTQIDNGQLAPDLAEIRTSITNVSNEITQTVNKKLEDQSAAIQQIQKVQVDTNNNLNSMWAVKLQQMKDGRLYIAGIGAGIENTPAGMQSQVLLAADRIAMINPANGNTKPMFVGQGDQIFMNDVFLKRLTAPTITSGGSPPVFSLTSDGKLTAKNADISGSVNANAGTLNNVTVNENCTIKGMLEANQVRGDFVKTVSKSFPKKAGTWGNTETPDGTVTVTISDDHNFDRQIIIPPIIFNGIAYDDPGSGDNPGGTRYTGYGFEVRKNGVLIASRETKGAIPGSYSAVIDMPSGRGSVTLEFKIFQKGNQGAGNITDCTVIVTKKAASGISIR
ncbi:TPA: DUF1983 domain-containing protein [Escherichia coli]|nr:DUF1983 domain-containing protein [Escherichia coli]HAG8374446.1 DUF1983 domain-containing protein [Escherichia coli]